MNALSMTALSTGFTFLMTAAGASVVFFFRKEVSHAFQRVFLGFAAGVMVAASVWSLLIPAIEMAEEAGGLPGSIIVDQFVQEKSYYRYLRDQPQVIRGIHFETKAESRYPAVAAASVIARYAFLKACDQMAQRYAFTFPKGAGAAVDQAIRQFVQAHGQEALAHVAKLHFANTAKALK